mgnify:CR=1 FL=1
MSAKLTDLAVVAAAVLIASLGRTHWTTALTITGSAALIWVALTMILTVIRRRADRSDA